MDPTDFLLLYQELGLRPGCSIDDFKLAYRRRIADLHPDRQRGLRGEEAEIARDRLQRLTQQYGAAIAFHRQHGRLPGASAPARGAEPATPAAPPAAGGDGVRRGWIAVAAAAVLAGTVAWQWFGADDDVATTRSDEPLRTAPEARREADSLESAPELRLGMRMRDVLEIEKEPITRGEDRWDYGPSWIAFERGRVSGWYSSPLRPLSHATTRPRPASPDEPPR